VKVATPLYLKFWLWLALNLLLLAALLLVIAGRDGPGWRMLLTEPVRERLVSIGSDVGRALSEMPDDEWPTTLAQFGALYGVTFEIGRTPRNGPAPRKSTHDALRSGKGGGEKGPPPRPTDDAGRSVPDGGPGKGPPPPRIDRRMRADLIMLRGGFVGPFELTIPVSVEKPGRPSVLYDLTAGVGDLFGLLGFLGVQKWVLYPLLALGVSALLWLPFIWSITRTVTRITHATERIAEGELDARIVADRRDELGQLADSVNRMAGRLGGHLAAQKQFLADVAHEIASPLARLRAALGLLAAAPQRTPPEQTLQDMNDDLQQMADMLYDLLLFSRTDPAVQRSALGPVPVLAVAAVAIEREAAIDRVAVHGEPEVYARADPAMLSRALANLVRNAVRYAGDRGQIELNVQRQGDWVVIDVRDRGPGVPESVLPRLGEPFFRVESSRTRDSGGFGLGLAIVKRCAEACGGSVVFRNRDGGGFEVEMRLRAAAPRTVRR
jgi:two-component system sensor histidine kinase CpxA